MRERSDDAQNVTLCTLIMAPEARKAAPGPAPPDWGDSLFPFDCCNPKQCYMGEFQ